MEKCYLEYDVKKIAFWPNFCINLGDYFFPIFYGTLYIHTYIYLLAVSAYVQISNGWRSRPGKDIIVCHADHSPSCHQQCGTQEAAKILVVSLNYILTFHKILLSRNHGFVQLSWKLFRTVKVINLNLKEQNKIQIRVYLNAASMTVLWTTSLPSIK